MMRGTAGPRNQPDGTVDVDDLQRWQTNDLPQSATSLARTFVILTSR